MVGGRALAIAMAMVLGGCGGSVAPKRVAAPAPQRGGTLTDLELAPPDSLDPGRTYTAFGIRLAYLMHRPLLAPLGDAARPVPDLAARMPRASNGGRTLTVVLRRGVRFSPPVNRLVTASDVKCAIERGRRGSVSNPYFTSYFANVARIETPSDHEVVFHLRRPTAGTLLGALSLPLSAPVPCARAAKFDRRTPSRYAFHQVATGPYMLRTGVTGRFDAREGLYQRLLLVRNPNWDPDTDPRPAYVDRIRLLVGIGDNEAVTRQVLAGRRMITNAVVPPALLEQIFARHRDQLDLFSFPAISWIWLNTQLAPLDDLDVRKAIVAATDRALLLRLGAGPLKGAVATHFLPPDVPGFEQAGGERGFGVDYLDNPNGNLALAEKYMRRAGYRSGRYDGSTRLLLVRASRGTEADRAARAFKRTLRALGFRARYSTKRELCQRPGTVHVCVWAWIADFLDPQAMLGPTFNGDAIRTSGNTNVAELDVPAINRAMKAAEAVTDPRLRAQKWAQIVRLIVEQAPAVPLSWDINNGVHSRDVHAVASSALGAYDLAYAWIER